LDDARARTALATRDAGVHAALELLKGRKPPSKDNSGSGLTAMTPAWK
jgi:hypothetical protein